MNPKNTSMKPLLCGGRVERWTFMGVLWAVFIASRRLADGAYRAKGAHERVRLGGGGERKMWSQRGILVRNAEGGMVVEFDGLGNLRQFPSNTWDNAWEIKASYPVGTKDGLNFALYEVQTGGNVLKLVVADQNPLVLRIATALEHGHAEGLTQIRRIISSTGAASKLAEPAIAAKIKSLGNAKAAFLGDLEEIAGLGQNLGKLTPETVEAWGAVSKMPAAVRRDFFTLETVARHITERSKSPAAIAAELTASGTYDNWLADHLVTYLKNGHTLDKSSIDGAFATHIDVVETVASNSVSGGHNRLAFLSECFVNNPTKRVVIISESDLSPPISGWKKVHYKTLLSGTPPSSVTYDAAGNITGPFNSPSSAPKIKTVYDPSEVSADNVKEMGYKAYKQAIQHNRFGPEPNEFNEIVDGIEIQGFFNNSTTNKIRTWYPK